MTGRYWLTYFATRRVASDIRSSTLTETEQIYSNIERLNHYTA